jgi:phage tail sheath protein FI
MFFGLKSRTNAISMVYGSFAPNGSSAVASTSLKGKGFSVARTGTGVFVITLSKTPPWYEIVYCDVKLHMGTPTGATACMTTHTLSTTGTVTITATDIAAAAADVAAAATNRIDFCLALRKGVRPS